MKYIIFVFLALLIGCGSCQMKPDPKDFGIKACFYGADCLYRNKDNKDKSSCMPYFSECNAFNKYVFCLDEVHRPEGITFKECWLYLNQK